MTKQQYLAAVWCWSNVDSKQKQKLLLSSLTAWIELSLNDINRVRDSYMIDLVHVDVKIELAKRNYSFYSLLTPL